MLGIKGLRICSRLRIGKSYPKTIGFAVEMWIVKDEIEEQTTLKAYFNPLIPCISTINPNIF
jgi:hypothetical protein